MAQVGWLSGDQLEKIRPFLPKERGVGPVDSAPKVWHGSIHVVSVIQKGLGWVMSQHVWPISNPLQGTTKNWAAFPFGMSSHHEKVSSGEGLPRPAGFSRRGRRQFSWCLTTVSGAGQTRVSWC